MPVWFEIKKYAQAYKRIIFGILSSALTCALLLAGVNTLLARERLFEPFSVGVVEHDASGEIRFVFDFFSDAIALDYMDKPEAEVKLAAGAIPAYVELPNSFASDIMSGANTPFMLYGNSDLPLQLAMSKLLAAGGVAFLSSSQAGIYATMDYAAAHGLSRDFINRNILYPINIAFVKKLLDYESFYTVRDLPLTAGTSTAAHYAFTFLAFLFMINLLSFTPVLRGYTPAVYARYRLAGQSLLTIQCVRLAGLVVVNALWAVPVYVIAAKLTDDKNITLALLTGFALTVCVGAFALMVEALCKNEASFGIFVFVTALVMLFLSGGVVPLVYLPRGIHALRFISIPHWAAAGTVEAVGILLIFSSVFFGVVCIVEFLRLRFPRAV